jgi:putative two-component system response regulator
VTTPAIAGVPGGRGEILVVEDDEQVRGLVVHLLRVTGYAVTAVESAEQAAELLSAMTPDLILLDMQLPGRSGLDLAADIRAEERLRLTPIVMVTSAVTNARRARAFEVGVTDFLAKPFSHVELTARVRALMQLKFATNALENAEMVIVSLAHVIDARDPYTGGHSARVSLYATLLADRIGLSDASIEAVRQGALFHDFGKIGVPDRVLLKPGKLTDLEYDEIKRHPSVGRNLLQNMRTLASSLEVVHHHHERMDGSGYPDHLEGEAIPVTARVCTIADIFDALTTARVYRGALSREESMRIMSEEVRKGWWDGRLLDEFRGVLETLPENDPRIVASQPQLPDRGFGGGGK